MCYAVMIPYNLNTRVIIFFLLINVKYLRLWAFSNISMILPHRSFCWFTFIMNILVMITKACCYDVIQYSKFMIILKGTKWRQHQSKVLYEILIYKNLFIVIDFLSVLCVCSIYGHWTRDYFLKMYIYTNAKY